MSNNDASQAAQQSNQKSPKHKNEQGSNSNNNNNNSSPENAQQQQLVKPVKKGSIGFLSNLIGSPAKQPEKQPVIEEYIHEQQQQQPQKRNVRNTLFQDDSLVAESFQSFENHGEDSNNLVNNNASLVIEPAAPEDLLPQLPPPSKSSSGSMLIRRQSSPPKQSMANNLVRSSPHSPKSSQNALNIDLSSSSISLPVRNNDNKKGRPNSVFLTKLKHKQKKDNPAKQHDQHPSRNIIQARKPKAKKKRPYSTGLSPYHDKKSQLSPKSYNQQAQFGAQNNNFIIGANSPDLLNVDDSKRRLTVHGRRISTVYIYDNVEGFKLSPSNTVMKKPGPLSFLPDELLLELMRWLEPEDLGRICTVCKRLYVFAETDLLWKDIARNYFPEETIEANNEKKKQAILSSSSLFIQPPLTPHQMSKNKYLQSNKSKKNSVSSVPDSRSLMPKSINQQLLTSRFYKNVFVEAYMKDLHLLRTGIWRNTSWKPKKSPWSKADYTYVHEAITNSSVLHRGIPIKVVVVGDGAVGKTSLLCRYANDEFPEDYVPTIFENFSTQVVYQNNSYSVSLWDTAGPEDFDKLRPMSYKGADIFLLCFSLVNSYSLINSMERWQAELCKHAPNVPIMLCGTKLDLRVSRNYINQAKRKNNSFEPVPFETGVEMARKLGAVGYAETSSLTSHGVAEIFNEVMRYGVIFSLAQLQAQQKSPSRCISM